MDKDDARLAILAAVYNVASKYGYSDAIKLLEEAIGDLRNRQWNQKQ